SMVASGHMVDVLCELPNHPQGVIFPGYKGKFSVRQKKFGATVHHLPIFASPKKTFLPRVLMYLSFSFSASVYILLKRPKYDLMYISSPPLFSAFCGLLSKVLFPRRKVVFEIRDLWPDSAIELGELRNGLLIKLSLWLERRIYQASDLVVGATGFIGKIVISKGIKADKVLVSFNGVDADILASYNPSLTKDPNGVFTAVFAGNVGLAQGLDIIVETAKLMQDDPILFRFVGNGPATVSLKRLCKEYKLTNVDFLAQVPRTAIGAILQQAHCGLLPLKDISVLSGALPSKMFTYMALELPIVASLRGEAEAVIKEAKAGLVVPPGDAKALAQTLRKLISSPAILSEMGVNGRNYVLQNYQRSTQAEKLVREIETLI
ncbi:MAG: glycosyltransferase family 4 protein, partial [Candidatus Cloacimonadota bacterium]